ncbi:carbonic anhydrase 14-like [Hemiscyllium ocellatum]|uniref:carbonic anhydrase 14-like n=1 Tax=Hemiscyllium ocellatum TaxID=170820 RepID=UPI002966BC7F|nr:carbonic anhydrase 14-like [Hemiscyllium ocellatum]
MQQILASIHWTYEGSLGQENWKREYVHCGERLQSPIDIETDVVTFDPSLTPVLLKGYSDPDREVFTLSNNGHTVQLTLPSAMYVHGLSVPYRTTQMHFHWGSQDHPEGSEHLVDGERAQAEMHVVNYNSEKYRNVSEAMSKEDGLLVLGIRMEVGQDINPAYENILRYLDSIAHAGQEVTIPSFDLQSLFPKQLDKYFTYSGSLTTPPCFQSVQWIVFHQPVRLSQSQFVALKSKLFSTGPDATRKQPLVNNFRKAQPLNDRKIRASFSLGWAVNFRRAMRSFLKALTSKVYQ